MPESHGNHDHILLSQIRDCPNLEGQVPVFIFPKERVAQLYPQTLGSFFVGSYVWKGHDRGFRPCLHTDSKMLNLPRREPRSLGRSADSQSLYRLSYPGSLNFALLGTVHIENTVSITLVQQYLYLCMRISYRGNSFTYQLPSDSPGFVNVFTDRYL
jgi:hypothetical protein